MKKKVVGIIGCGVIGSALAKVIATEFKQQADLKYLNDLHHDRVAKIIKKIPGKARFSNFKELIRKSDLIIECASAAVAPTVVCEGLKLNKQVIVLSSGGLVQAPEIFRLLKRTKGKLWIPTGAIAGVDALLAAREAGLKSVTLKIGKSPQGLCEAPFFKDRPFPKLKKNEEVCVFRGNAIEAVKCFPKNVNVSAVLSLAGIGVRRTRVEVWTSEKYVQNQHEILISAKSGTLHFTIKNVPSKLNPKTSALAIYSVIALVRKYFSPLKIGT